MDIYNEHFLDLIKSLEHHNVQYLVVGGFAVIEHGFSRSTGDLDLYVKDTTENRRQLISALEAIGMDHLEPLMTAPLIAGYCEILMDDGMYADLMAKMPGLNPDDFDEHYRMASINIVEQVTVRFLSYNHLIANKQATGRPKDLLDVAALESIRNRGNQ